MAKSDSKQRQGTGVDPKVVARVEEKAKQEGLDPSVAKEIVEESVEAGVAPDKVEEVAEEAVRVEREDQGRSR
jgi:hypothetical protein